MSWYFTFITASMNRLRYPYKFMLIGALLIIPIFISNYLLIADANRKLDTANEEHHGLNYHRTLQHLHHLLQQRRLLFISLDSPHSTVIKQTKLEVDQIIRTTINELDNLHKNSNFSLNIQNLWTNISSNTDHLINTSPDEHIGDTYIAHTKLMTNISYLMYKVADRSGLLHDANPGTNELIGMITNQFSLILSHVDSTIGLTIHWGVNGNINEEQHVRLEMIRELNNYFFDEMQAEMNQGALATAYPENAVILRRIVEQWVQETDDYTLLMQRILKNPVPSPTTFVDLIAQGNQMLENGYALYYQATEFIEQILQQRQSELRFNRNRTIVLLAICIGIVITLFLAISLSVMRAVKTLKRASLQIAAGHLETRIQLDTKDELKVVEVSFNETVRVFGDLLKQKQEQEQRIRYQALYDALTELPNRFMFLEKIEKAITQAKKTELGHSVSLALLYIDLDGFKQVNDQHGHHVGDLLLQEVSKRLRSSVRSTDLIARIGGDEFTVIMSNVVSQKEAQDLANRIATEMRRMIIAEGNELHISASIGIALYPKDGEYADALIRKADQAMYAIKKNPI